jgi:osmoprotectant transport system substrate-binding protein
MKFKQIASTVLVITLFCSLIGCSKKGDSIRIGSKDFTESLIVAEIYALALEDAGYKVERKLNIAGSIVHTSIISDEIDLYPEYTGTGLLTVLKMDLITDPDEVYRVVKEEYRKQFNITWLDQSMANDSNGLVIRTETAKQFGIYTVSDLQNKAENIRFASQGEFEQREDGIPGLEKLYGEFNFKSIKVYDNGLKYEILKNDEADIAPAYTTEGQLVNTDLFTLLEDDQHFWPPYRLTPIIRNNVLEANPAIAEKLNKVSAMLNTETITSLNAKVDVERREYEEVAKEYWDLIRNIV